MRSRPEPSAVDRARLRAVAGGGAPPRHAAPTAEHGMRVVVVAERDLHALVSDAVAAAVGAVPAEDAILTREETAALLKVHEKTVSALVKQAGLPAHRLTSGEYRFHRAEVIDWLRARPSALDDRDGGSD